MDIIEDILEKFEKFNPNPKTELNYINEFTFLVAIILSAQATDKQVNIVTKNLFKEIQFPKDVLKIGNEKLESLVKSIGLFKNKAKNIYKLSEILIEKYDSKVPHDFNDLISLPGVGRKTASVFLNEILHERRIAVDTHVLRLVQRIGFLNHVSNNNSEKISSDEKLDFSKQKKKNEFQNIKYTPENVEKALFKVVPLKYQDRVSNWLVLHGRYVCTARNPKCEKCIIKDYCDKLF